MRVTNREINDWYRLVERQPAPYYISYFVDEHDRIAGKLVQSIPGTAPVHDRLEEFATWARRKYPGLLDELMPEGRIDSAKYRSWKERLLEWRADAGRPKSYGPASPRPFHRLRVPSTRT